MIVVSDTSCLHYLAALKQLSVLPALFGSVVIPPAVRSELAASPRASEILDSTWLSVARPRTMPSDIATHHLDAGECEAIALAIELHADRLLVDERDATEIARGMGVPTVGTLVVLLAAKRKGFLTALAPLVTQLRAAGFFVTDAVIERLIREAGE